MEFHATGLQVRGLATALKLVLIHHLLQKQRSKSEILKDVIHSCDVCEF